MRASHDFSLNTVTTNQSIKSLCPENQNIKPKYPFSEIIDLTPSEVEPKTFSPSNMSFVMETVPIRYDSVHYNTVSDVERSGTTHYGTVPDANHFELLYPSTLQSDKFLNTILVPLTVPLAFVQGLKPSKRNNTHLKNKYLKKRKFPRTPLLVPRIIELSKDVDPHLDHALILDPLTVVTMGLAAPELDALGQPFNAGFYPEVSSNPSTIKHQHPKPNHESGGEEISYIFSAWVHKQRTRMPMAACTIEGKICTSYRPRLSPDGEITEMVHFVYTISTRRTMPQRKPKSSHSCGKKLDNSYSPDLSFNVLNGEIMPDLYSDEY